MKGNLENQQVIAVRVYESRAYIPRWIHHIFSVLHAVLTYILYGRCRPYRLG